MTNTHTAAKGIAIYEVRIPSPDDPDGKVVYKHVDRFKADVKADALKDQGAWVTVAY